VSLEEVEEMTVAPDSSATSELFDAIKAGDLARGEALLDSQPELASARDANGIQAIVQAVYRGRRDFVDLLLARDAEIDLFAAAALGQSERLTTLLNDDSQTANGYSPDGFTPLGLAAYFGHTEVVRVLLASGANVKAVSKNFLGNTPLHTAIAGSHNKHGLGVPIVEMIIAAGADIDAPDAHGWTPVNLAAHEGVIEIVELLIARGADVNRPASNGDMPLATALKEGNAEVAALLQQHGATEV
jgi:uncharacterized protein